MTVLLKALAKGMYFSCRSPVHSVGTFWDGYRRCGREGRGKGREGPEAP